MEKSNGDILCDIYTQRVVTNVVYNQYIKSRVFSNYMYFCEYVLNSIESNSITTVISKYISSIVNEVKTVLGFTEEETYKLILNFFLNGEYKEQYLLILTIIRTQGSYLF
jgi:hypothetical protein